MITKITGQKLLQSQLGVYWFSKLTQEGRSVVAEMPNVELPVRSKYEHEDRFSKDLFYDLNSTW